MVTLVGTEKDFCEAVKHLIELDFAAAASYQKAIESLHSSEFRNKLKEFKADHAQHAKDCSEILKEFGQEPPNPSTITQVFTQGKVIFAKLLGDTAILKALRSNEQDTHTAYERLSEHPEIKETAIEKLKQGLKDEERHHAWLARMIEELETPS